MNLNYNPWKIKFSSSSSSSLFLSLSQRDTKHTHTAHIVLARVSVYSVCRLCCVSVCVGGGGEGGRGVSSCVVRCARVVNVRYSH